MANMLSAGQLRTLAEYPEGICISLFLPAGCIGEETAQNQLKLKHALQEVEHRLKAYGLHAHEKEHLMAPLEALVDDESFWLQAVNGLAIFRSSDLFRIYCLPDALREQVVVGEHFYLKPLFPFTPGDARFYILALSQNEVRLFEATRSIRRAIPLFCTSKRKQVTRMSSSVQPSKHSCIKALSTLLTRQICPITRWMYTILEGLQAVLQQVNLELQKCPSEE